MERLTKKPENRNKIIRETNEKARKLCEEITANYKMPMLRVFAWTLLKIFNQIYEQVVIVNEQVLQGLKNYDTAVDGPIILVPTHRSYIDFLLVSYIFFSYKI